MGKYDIPIDFGPNRHGVTRGATVYFFDPSGNRNEVFTGGYVYYPDNPALIWDTSNFGNALFSQGNVVVPSFLKDRKRVVSGKSVSVRVDCGGLCSIKTKI